MSDFVLLRALNPLFERRYTGRFYSLSEPLRDGDVLASRCRDLNAVRPVRYDVDDNAWWCGPDGEVGSILEDHEDPIYRVGDGVFIGWLRVEVRKPPTHAVHREADAISMAEYAKAYAALKGQAKREVLFEAKRRVRPRVIPAVKMVPLVVVLIDGDWLVWVKGGMPPSALSLVGATMSRPELAPLAWDGTEYGWNAISRAAIHGLLKGESAGLDKDVTLMAVKLSGQSVDIRTDAPGETGHIETMRKLGVMQGEIDVKRMEIDVRLNAHEGVLLHLDQDGVKIAEPPTSAGGLTAEVLKRRFGDVVTGAARVSEVLGALIEDALEEA